MAEGLLMNIRDLLLPGKMKNLDLRQKRKKDLERGLSFRRLPFQRERAHFSFALHFH